MIRRMRSGHDLELARMRARLQAAEAERARCVCNTSGHPHRTPGGPTWTDIELPNTRQPYPRPAATEAPGPGKARLD